MKCLPRLLCASAISLLMTLAFPAKANVCGTDFQNFNPTTNGLDFVTVHSSETLKPCVVNNGLFFNYAANTLNYYQSFNGLTPGGKGSDRILGADLSLGVGLSDNWDIGFSVPFVLSQEIKDDGVAVSKYGQNGATEIKVNTKYRFIGDESGGVAGIFSINNNLIVNNPFTGPGAGPTYNFELAADTTYKNWAIGVNGGYRKRNPGDTIPNQPFVPLQDQWIYSMATSYLFEDYDTKVIFEIYGSKATKTVDYDANRSLDSLEGLMGLKYDMSRSVALHVGGSTKIGEAIGNPDWRIYTGINWAVGPVCYDQTAVKIEPLPVTQVAPHEEDRFEGKLPEVFRFEMEVFFDYNSDVVRPDHYKQIEEFARMVAATGFKKLQVDGHTDSVGGVTFNLGLSVRRAEAVKQFFVQKFGMPEKKVFTKGFGKSRPIADNGNYQGRQMNRRVEIKIWK